MNLLLDTHVFLWWIGEPGQLSEEARSMIADQANAVLVSAVSAWEISIKRNLRRLDLRDEDFAFGTHESGFVELPVSAEHDLLAGSLPPHHGDPFDRMLVAQARAEDLRLATRNRAMAMYDVNILQV